MDDLVTEIHGLGLTASDSLVKFVPRKFGEEDTFDTAGVSSLIQIADYLSGPNQDDRRTLDLLKYQSTNEAIKDARKLTTKVYLERIKNHITTSCMPDFATNPNLQPVYQNYFVHIGLEEANYLDERINKRINMDDKTIKRIKHTHIDANMAVLTYMQMTLERVKLPIYVQLAKEWLDSSPNNKIAIMVMYKRSINLMYRELERYGVVVIEGKLEEIDRKKAIDAFQAYNTKTRVIIATLPTGGEGIDLHDTSPGGMFPRMLMMLPVFSTKKMVQAAGRVFRDGVTSRPIIRVVYTAWPTSENKPVDDLEARFYHRIACKTKDIKMCHASGQNDIMPCDYMQVVHPVQLRGDITEPSEEEEVLPWDYDKFKEYESEGSDED